VPRAVRFPHRIVQTHLECANGFRRSGSLAVEAGSARRWVGRGPAHRRTEPPRAVARSPSLICGLRPSSRQTAGSGDHCGEDLRQVQHPGKTTFSAELSRFFMACPGKCFPKELILQPSEFEKSLIFKRDFDFLKMFTAVVWRPAPSARGSIPEVISVPFLRGSSMHGPRPGGCDPGRDRG
jgi:hypothetical protein